MISLICLMLHALGLIVLKDPALMLVCMLVEAFTEVSVPVLIAFYKDL